MDRWCNRGGGRAREEKRRRKKISVCENGWTWLKILKILKMGEHGRKVVKHCVFPMRWAFGGSKSIGSLKRRMRCHLVRWEKKLHAVVARRKFRHENAQSTSTSEPFWKLRCGKSACGCGAKLISKSNVSKCYRKHLSLEALLEGYFFRKRTPL